MMSFGTAVKTCFRKTFTFSGRATRAEYWWFTLFTWLIGILIIILLGNDAETAYGVLVFYLLIMFIPNLSLIFRRLHDVGLSGAWVLTLLLGGLGSIFLLIVSLEPSDSDNEYGPKPLDNGDNPSQKATTPSEVNEDNVVDVTDVEL